MPNCKPSGHFVQCQHVAVTNIVKKEYEHSFTMKQPQSKVTSDAKQYMKSSGWSLHKSLYQGWLVYATVSKRIG